MSLGQDGRSSAHQVQETYILQIVGPTPAVPAISSPLSTCQTELQYSRMWLYSPSACLHACLLVRSLLSPPRAPPSSSFNPSPCVPLDSDLSCPPGPSQPSLPQPAPRECPARSLQSAARSTPGSALRRPHNCPHRAAHINMNGSDEGHAMYRVDVSVS